MNGIHAAFTGRIGKDAEVRIARDGKAWASFPVAVDAKADGEAPAMWVRVALFGDAVAAVARSMSETPAARREYGPAVPMLPALRVFRLERERSESPRAWGGWYSLPRLRSPILRRTELGAGFLDTIAAPGGTVDDELSL